MINPNRSRQLFSNNNFMFVAQSWRTLSGANRAAWIAYATAFPRPTRLNPASYLNGFNYFCAANNLRQLSNPGTITSNPSGAQGTATYNDFILINAAGVLTADIDVSFTSTNWVVILFLTERLGVGQSFIQPTPKFTLSLPQGSIAPANITAKYTQLFGGLPPVGAPVGFRLVAIKLDNGQIFDFGSQQVIVT